MLINQFLWLRILRDGDSGGAGGGSGDANPEKDKGNGAGDGEATRTLKQSELDAMFASRAKQGGQSAVAELLKELGVEKVDDIKTTLQQAAAAKQAQMTELEKAKQDAADAAKVKTEAEAKVQAVTELANTRLMKSEVMLEAAKAEHKFRPEALADVWAFVDRSKLKVKEDGTVEGVAEAVKEVAKTKPYMVGEASRGNGTPSREKGKQPPAGKQPAEDKPRKSLVNF